MPAALRFRSHGQPHAQLIGWLFTYQVATPGTELADYQLLEPDANGLVCSRTFPGLWLAVEALLQGNMPEVLALLQQGLNSAEHQAFALLKSQLLLTH